MIMRFKTFRDLVLSYLGLDTYEIVLFRKDNGDIWGYTVIGDQIIVKICNDPTIRGNFYLYNREMDVLEETEIAYSSSVNKKREDLTIIIVDVQE